MSTSAPARPFTASNGFEIISADDALFVNLSRLRDTMVEKAEELSILLEANMKPAVAAGLNGDDQAKARHLYETQARKLNTELTKLLRLAENFRNHIY
jgi:hypothetical protein